ncbi:MAG: leucine-rich repeat protein, partial [Bacteroidales bacterium]|nr:leucine-rich repeat protein [Candidatus Sodaliphilus aphodohippi]
MKKNLLLAFAAVCALGASAQDFTVNNVNYNILDENAATVEITTGSYTGQTLESRYGDNPTVAYSGKNYTVVAVGENAFKDQTPKFNLGILNLGSNIASIAEGAFQNAKIGTTNNSYQMNTVVIGSSTINWHPKAFIGNHIRAFNISSDSRYMTLAETMAISPANAHRGIIFSKDGTVLYVFPGDQCKSTDRDYTYTPGVLYTLPASVTTIADYAFSGNPNLRAIATTTNLKVIGEEALSHSVIEGFTVPAGVTTLGPGFIAGAKKITAIGVAEDNAYFQAINGCVYTKVAEAAPALKDAEGMTLVAVPYAIANSLLEVADGTTAIAPKAALDADIKTLELPASLETIGANAFKGDNAITKIICNAIEAPAGADFEEEVFAAELVLPENANLDSYYNDPVWSQFELPASHPHRRYRPE